MLRTALLFALGIVPATAAAHAAAQAPLSLQDIDLRIGTAGEGETYPAVGVPYGMTHWTPETHAGEVKCVRPYTDKDSSLTGFRGSHFVSGSCMRDYGSFSLMPEQGTLITAPESRAVAFRHADEQIAPNRYAVQLKQSGIAVELSGLSRSGVMRFTARRGGRIWVVLQNHATLPGGWTDVDAAHGELTGANPVRRLYAGNGQPAGFRGYFVVRFNRSVRSSGTWTGSATQQTSHETASGEIAHGAFAGFDVRAGEFVEARIGTSFVSVAEARRNLDAEIGGADLPDIEHRSAAAWREVLRVLDVDASPQQRRMLATALYHTALQPRTFNDVSGSYPTFAGGTGVQHMQDGIYYDDFSMWDTFRAVHPWILLTDPARETAMIQSLLDKSDQGGWLPDFPAWNSYTSEMVGDHAVAVLADAMAKGLSGFDAERAYRIVRRNAMEMPSAAEYADGRGRRCLEPYLHLGYVPLEATAGNAFHSEEQVSRTLAYAYDDALVGRMAARLHHDDDERLFAARGENWRKVLDPATGYVRGRHADGRWAEASDPDKPARWITEATPALDTFFVPQNTPGLMEALGGREPFVRKLDLLVTRKSFDPSNEPSNHVPYLYNFAGRPDRAADLLHDTMTRLYTDAPDGIPGNDDAGQMSAWFVFSALGFYPVTPGSDEYEIGTPLLEQAVLHLPAGRSLRITAVGAGRGMRYVRGVRLNGKPLPRHFLRHRDIVQGGELVFQMSASPAPPWWP